ncbi:MAG: hypothetical protein KKA19_09380 [Candidatus Margulisbacteria bacterium]|nr:hypothetical protein [Candidatus Margulisiibacteriota bacterium]
MKNKKYISTSLLLKKSFQIIRLDYAVLLPYFISSFLLVLLSSFFLKGQAELTENISPELFMFYLAAWLFALLAQATTVFMAQKLANNTIPNIAESFSQAITRFPLLVFLLLISMFFFVGIGLLLNYLLKNYFYYAALPLIMFTLVYFQIFPVIILLEKASFFEYYRLVINYFRNNISNIIRFFLGISIISLITILLVSSLDTTGSFSKEVLSPLIQGLSGAIITIISVIFYQVTKSIISINA